MTLMQRILAACGNDLNRLGKWEVRDFSRFKGMGPAKSITVMASLELGKRRKLQERSGRTAIRSCADIYELFHPLLCDLATEEFWVLLMNHAAKVIDKVRISRGGIDQTTADVRSILREALLQRATQIALIHNHPSGNPHPSDDDRQLTDEERTELEKQLERYESLAMSDKDAAKVTAVLLTAAEKAAALVPKDEGSGQSAAPAVLMERQDEGGQQEVVLDGSGTV